MPAVRKIVLVDTGNYCGMWGEQAPADNLKQRFLLEVSYNDLVHVFNIL